MHDEEQGEDKEEEEEEEDANRTMRTFHTNLSSAPLHSNEIRVSCEIACDRMT